MFLTCALPNVEACQLDSAVLVRVRGLQPWCGLAGDWYLQVLLFFCLRPSTHTRTRNVLKGVGGFGYLGRGLVGCVVWGAQHVDWGHLFL